MLAAQGPCLAEYTGTGAQSEVSTDAVPSNLPGEGNELRLLASNDKLRLETAVRPMPQAALEPASHSLEQTLEAVVSDGDTKQLTAAIRAAVQALSCGGLSSARTTEVRA